MRPVTVRPVPLTDTRPLRKAVLRPYQSLEELASHEPADAVALGAFDERGQLLAVGLVGAEGGRGSWRVRGMATAPEARGQGIGTAVLEALIEHAREHGATRIWCTARVPARSLYERAGFRVTSEQFEVERIGPHYTMELGDSPE
jgi:ribosomal protein S18 acetylase RimI-like enzyme